MGSIYCITNIVSDKVYIGSTIEPEIRLRTHRWWLEKGDHGNIHLQRSWNKHGPDAFEFEVIQNGIPDDGLLYVEQLYIDANDRLFNINLVADKPPSRKGVPWTAEQYAAMQATYDKKGRKPGRPRVKRGPLSEEHKAQIGAIHAKTFRFLNPDGELVVIHNLRAWCRENDIPKSGMYNVACGLKPSCRGWRRAPESDN